jgi:hypothetical protein
VFCERNNRVVPSVQDPLSGNRFFSFRFSVCNKGEENTHMLDSMIPEGKSSVSVERACHETAWIYCGNPESQIGFSIMMCV